MHAAPQTGSTEHTTLSTKVILDGCALNLSTELIIDPILTSAEWQGARCEVLGASPASGVTGSQWLGPISGCPS